jgi:hypothetical protein
MVRHALHGFSQGAIRMSTQHRVLEIPLIQTCHDLNPVRKPNLAGKVEISTNKEFSYANVITFRNCLSFS